MHMHESNEFEPALSVSKEELSRRIRKVRKALKFKQEELGAILGGGQPMISQWENGVIKDYRSALRGFRLLASYLKEPFNFEADLGRATEPYSPILQSPEQLSSFLEELGKDYPDGEWDLVLASTCYSHSNAPFRTSQILKNERIAVDENSHELPYFRVPKPRVEDVLADAKLHGEEFVLHLQNRWSHPGYLQAMFSLHANFAARASALILLKKLVLKRREVVVDAYDLENPLPTDDSLAEQLIDILSFKSEDALEPTADQQVELNEKCGFAMQFLLCVTELIQARYENGEIGAEKTLLSLLFNNVASYIEAYSTFGRAPAENVSKNQDAFAEVLSRAREART